MPLPELNLETHRHYEGSVEQSSGQLPASDQIWTSDDINKRNAILEDFRAYLLTLGDVADLTTAQRTTFVGAISSIINDAATTAGNQTWSVDKILSYLTTASFTIEQIAGLSQALMDASNSGGSGGGVLIDDTVANLVDTWSSSKINTDIQAVDAKAGSAITDAATADAKAVSAQTDATQAISNASGAATTAANADTKAQLGVDNAAIADSKAVSAQADATQALSDAATAQTTASNADAKADTATITANNAINNNGEYTTILVAASQGLVSSTKANTMVEYITTATTPLVTPTGYVPPAGETADSVEMTVADPLGASDKFNVIRHSPENIWLHGNINGDADGVVINKNALKVELRADGAAGWLLSVAG